MTKNMLSNFQLTNQSLLCNEEYFQANNFLKRRTDNLIKCKSGKGTLLSVNDFACITLARAYTKFTVVCSSKFRIYPSKLALYSHTKCLPQRFAMHCFL